MKTKYYLLIATMLLLFHNRAYGQYDSIDIELLRGGSLLDDDFKPAIINSHPKETILGYEWDSIYKDESKETKDSIKRWIEYYNLMLPEISVKTIVDICGKYFHLQSEQEVINCLIEYLENDCYSLCTAQIEKKELIKIVRHQLDSFSQTFSEHPFNQVWDESIMLSLQLPIGGGYITFDIEGNTHPLSDSINKLSVYFDSVNNYYSLLRFSEIFETIKKEKNTRIKHTLLTNLYIKLIHHSRFYRVSIYNEVYKITEEILNSIEGNSFSLEFKAYINILCAKMLATVEVYYFQAPIYSYLLTAEGELSSTEDKKGLLNTLRIIKANFWNFLPELFSKEYAYNVLKNQLDLPNTANNNFKYFTLLAEIYASWGYEIITSNYEIQQREQITILVYIATAYEQKKNKDFENKGNEFFKYDFKLLKSLSAFFEIKQQHEKQAQILNKLLYYNLFCSNSWENRFFHLTGLPLQIANNFRNRGKKQNYLDWISTLVSDSIKLTIQNQDTSQLHPNDIRLWDSKVYNSLKDSILSLSLGTFYNGSYLTPFDIHNRKLLKRVAFFCEKEAIKRKDWKEAYQLAKKQDSLNVFYLPEFFLSMIDTANFRLFNAKKNYLEGSIKELEQERNKLKSELYFLEDEKNDLEQIKLRLQKETKRQQSEIVVLNTSVSSLGNEKRKLQSVNFELQEDTAEKNAIIYQQDTAIANRAIIIDALNTSINSLLKTLATGKVFLILIGVFCIILIVVSHYAFKQRNKAKEAQAKAEILSYTMYQMGHMAPLCINNINERFGNSLVTPIKNTLADLSNLLREFYEYSKTEINYEQEYNLVCNYVDLAFQTPNGELPSGKIEANWREYPELKLPTYILFNTIQNAFKHGRIWSDMKNSSRVIANIKEKEGKYVVTITNPLLGREKKIERGTGMKYISAILSYWNGKKTGNFNYSVTNDMFNFTFVFRSKK